MSPSLGDLLPYNQRMVGRPRILVIADNSADGTLIQSLLDMYNYEVVHADGAIDAVSQANEDRVDVTIICSQCIEDVSSLCVQVRAASAFEDVPVVFVLHEEVDGAVMMEAQYYGALACLNFSASEYQLMAQVYNLVRIKFLQDELKQRMADLEYMASTDPLTGLYNRRFCFRRLEEELARSARANSELTLIYLDIDHFKPFNDTYGHAAGDKILKCVSQTISSTLRRSDVFGRIGGEEFLILLPATSEDVGKIIAERLREKVSECMVAFETHELHCTISCGVYCCDHAEALNVDQAVHCADVALYQAKERGRNRVVVYSRGMLAS
ncbi:diguanylate cyclase [bacterium]|nr:diguanylate cyclase [bacterium]